MIDFNPTHIADCPKCGDIAYVRHYNSGYEYYSGGYFPWSKSKIVIVEESLTLTCRVCKFDMKMKVKDK